jgi:23S rRNA U2552 (ribose-2'-O)-methylase RlmE/FtsJ
MVSDLEYDKNGHNIYREQDNFKTYLKHTIISLLCLKKKGNFIMKINESYTLPTIKLLCLLIDNFENVHIIKPLISKNTNSEKYVICMNYLKNNKNIIKYINII